MRQGASSSGVTGYLVTAFLVSAGALAFAKNFLTQTNRLRRHFTELVVLDEFQCLLQGETDWRNQRNGFVFAGSTHEQDLEVIKKSILNTDFSNSVWVIVPHETDEETLRNVTHTFQSQSCSLYSKPSISKANILVIDKKGILKFLYRLAHLAYVGGGFGQGIHNVLEASAYGIPVICGPNIEKSNEAIILKNEGILAVISSENDMNLAVAHLNNKNQYFDIQQKTKKCFDKQLQNSPSEILKEALRPYLS